MNPLNWTKRPGRWLMAAAMAMGIGHAPAFAASLAMPEKSNSQLEAPVIKIAGELQNAFKGLKSQKPGLEEPGEEQPEANPPRVIFQKTGAQIDCDYVVYKIRFGIKADAATWANPAITGLLSSIKLDLKDQLPAGLSVTSTAIVGDVTDAGGVNLPTASLSTNATPNDTMSISDFRLSSSDLNGDGSPTERYVDIKITAKIDMAAFPAVTQVLNQAVATASMGGGAGNEYFSHDPALPDDGDEHTGEKTKISIDVTKCDPPGGGDRPEEACFKVDTGTVDCDKDGAGAFIYHMNVGAEMAGRVIELSTTNPGVTIAPAAQVVPAGGGVLNWTITGALPGDVVHLVVIGTETFAGPNEGWGICCTQTIDITIPEDLDCPKKQPDIKIEKKAEVGRCTKDGGCKFAIRVSNVGDAPYNGPIVLSEVTLPGNAIIDGGPNAPWVCAPLSSPMLCTHPLTSLNPGAFIDLNLSFKPGPGWEARLIRNCAKYNYDESGKPLFGSQLNDRACAEIPLCNPNGTTPQDRDCLPPAEKKADLQIRKTAREFCTADGLCLYRILVTNVGSVTHNGPLSVIDAFPGGTPTSVTFTPTPPWVCAALTPSQFKCDHPGIVLVPGASVQLAVRAIVPLDYRDGKVENCAKVGPIPNETNLANNSACATAKLRQPDGKPVMKITKTCSPGIAGAQIFCTITVSNSGTAAPAGPIHVNDTAVMLGGGAPVAIQTVATDGADWTCTAVPAANLSCQIPGAALTPGTSRHFTAGLTVNGGGRFKNCARGDFGPAPGDDVVYPFGEACAEGGTDVTVKKTGPAQCEIGQPCAFNVTVTNNGSSGFSGPVQVGDALEIEGIGRLEGVEIQSIEPPFGCAQEPSTLPFGCTTTVNIGAGESQSHVVTVIIGESDTLANVTSDGVSGRNCAGVTGDKVTIGAAGQSAPGEIDAGDAYSCHPFTLVKKQDEKQCSEGFVKNANGRCVCPEGSTFSQGRGRCIDNGSDPAKPVEPEQPQTTPLCRLLPGMIRTTDNRCICPRGTELRDGACKRPVVVDQCRLLPGQIRTRSGQCICPRGTELRNGACKRPVVEQCRLLPGQIRTKNGQCICPRNTVLKGGRCEITSRQCTLLPGQIRTKDNKCVCPRGTVLGRKGCVKVVDQGTICPKGTRLINGECMRPVGDGPTVRRCPPGTIGVFPVCVRPDQIERRCPRGTEGNYPNCRRIIIDQKFPDIQLPGRDPQKNPG